MIKKLWAKFDGMKLTCFCEEGEKKCTDDACKEYVVKFTLIDREEDSTGSFLEKELYDKSKKLTSELNKATKHIKKLNKRI